MKYLAALAIGIGLMVHSPAFAEILKFGEENEASMEECLVAADKGLELPEETAAKKLGERRFLVKNIKMGTSWRVYEIFMSRPKELYLSCTSRSLLSRTN